MSTPFATPFPMTKDGALTAPVTGAGPDAGSPTTDGRPGGQLLGRVVQGAHEALDKLADGAAPHVQLLQQGMAAAGESLHERAEQARKISDAWADSLRGTVRENPLAAVMAALAAGALIARLARR